jgi:hypothetical protein
VLPTAVAFASECAMNHACTKSSHSPSSSKYARRPASMTYVEARCQRRRGIVLAVVRGSMLLEVACSMDKREGLWAGKTYTRIFPSNMRLLLDKVAPEVEHPIGPVRQIPGRGFGKATIAARTAAANSPNDVYAAVSSVNVPRFVRYPYAVFFVRDVKTGDSFSIEVQPQRGRGLFSTQAHGRMVS